MKMQMTEEEIIKKYKGNPTEKHINILADLNAVKPYVIKRILAKAGLMEEPAAPKKRGKKPKAEQNEKIQEADKTLNDIEKIESTKTISVRGEMPPQAEIVTPVPVYLIPEQIKKLCEYRLEEINVEILSLCDEIDKRSDEREQIKAFLRGEFKHEPEDGIHGPI